MQEREAEFQKRQSALAADPSNKHLEQYLTNAQVRLSQIQHTSSRLYAMDIGADQATLRTSYPDCSRYLILPCQARLALEDPRLRGYIAKLDNSAVHVPLEYRAVITGMLWSSLFGFGFFGSLVLLFFCFVLLFC